MFGSTYNGLHLRCFRLKLCAVLCAALLAIEFASPLGSGPAAAQGLVTVAAVSGALSAALEQFKAAISQAGEELRGLGNSLQANSQNVLQDMNIALKDRMDQGKNLLEGEELRMVTDAEVLTRQLQEATQKVLAHAGEEARRTIVEADISAYDALYSLPCRDQKPRILAAFPEQFIVSQSQPIMTLRGNFLRQGNDLQASADGKELKVVERLDHSIKVELPDDIAPPSLDNARTVSIQVSGLQGVERTLWFGLICREKTVAASPAAGAITIKPPIRLSLSGTIRATHLIESNTTELRNFDRTGNDHCDDSFDVSTQFCTATETAVRTTATLNVTSANCGSSAGSPQPSGPRCVLVPGHIQGCGANRGPFNTWLGCKGRGWLKYDLNLVVITKSRVPAGMSNISVAPSISDRSWSFPLPSAGAEPTYEYDVTIEQTQGNQLLNRWTVSGANPNSGPISSRTANGALAVAVAQ